MEKSKYPEIAFYSDLPAGEKYEGEPPYYEVGRDPENPDLRYFDYKARFDSGLPEDGLHYLFKHWQVVLLKSLAALSVTAFFVWFFAYTTEEVIRKIPTKLSYYCC